VPSLRLLPRDYIFSRFDPFTKRENNRDPPAIRDDLPPPDSSIVRPPSSAFCIVLGSGAPSFSILHSLPYVPQDSSSRHRISFPFSDSPRAREGFLFRDWKVTRSPFTSAIRSVFPFRSFVSGSQHSSGNTKPSFLQFLVLQRPELLALRLPRRIPRGGAELRRRLRSSPGCDRE